MMIHLRGLIGLCGVVLLLGAGAASAQTPGYITANPDRVTRAFGDEAARKIFSNAYTPVRQAAVLRSQKAIPGFDCPAEPQIALADVIPFPMQQGTTSWIERYVLGCTPRTIRNFLIFLEGDQPRVIDLLPGSTNADPLLQRDAIKGSYTAVATVAPKDCDKAIVTDIRLVSKIEGISPWKERWVFDLCGTRAEVEMTFTPSASSGTSWTASLIK
jgi:hypothetical protein